MRAQPGDVALTADITSSLFYCAQDPYSKLDLCYPGSMALAFTSQGISVLPPE